MFMQTLNPAMYLKWMMAPVDPRVWQLMMQPLNPAMYTGWLGTSMNPATYGTWGTWLNPNTYVPPVSGGMTGGTSFNFFDPTTWGAMTAPYGQPAGAAPAAGTPGYVNPFDPNVFLQMFNPAAYSQPAATPAPATK